MTIEYFMNHDNNYNISWVISLFVLDGQIFSLLSQVIWNSSEVLGILRLLLFGIIAQHGDLHSEYIPWILVIHWQELTFTFVQKALHFCLSEQMFRKLYNIFKNSYKNFLISQKSNFVIFQSLIQMFIVKSFLSANFQVWNTKI